MAFDLARREKYSLPRLFPKLYLYFSISQLFIASHYYIHQKFNVENFSCILSTILLSLLLRQFFESDKKIL